MSNYGKVFHNAGDVAYVVFSEGLSNTEYYSKTDEALAAYYSRPKHRRGIARVFDPSKLVDSNNPPSLGTLTNEENKND